MRGLFKTRRRKLAAGLTVLALVGAGAAVAAWLVTSTNGSGKAKVSSLIAPTVSEPSVYTGPGGQLFPGGTGTVEALVTNPNGTPLNVTGFSFDGSGTFEGLPPGCTADNFTLVPGTVAVPAQVPAGAVNLLVRFQDAIALSGQAPTQCQGATVSVVNGLQVSWSTP
jgi:hypothetical protein